MEKGLIKAEESTGAIAEAVRKKFRLAREAILNKGKQITVQQKKRLT